MYRKHSGKYGKSSILVAAVIMCIWLATVIFISAYAVNHRISLKSDSMQGGTSVTESEFMAEEPEEEQEEEGAAQEKSGEQDKEEKEQE